MTHILIEPQGLFATPKSVDELQKWIELHPPQDRIHLYTASGMTWNVLAESMNDYGDELAKIKADLEATHSALDKVALLDGEGARLMGKLAHLIAQL